MIHRLGNFALTENPFPRTFKDEKKNKNHPLTLFTETP